MSEEIFGPRSSCETHHLIFAPIRALTNGVQQVYVYEDKDFDKTLDLIDTTSEYALTGAMYVWRPRPTPTDT